FRTASSAAPAKTRRGRPRADFPSRLLLRFRSWQFGNEREAYVAGSVPVFPRGIPESSCAVLRPGETTWPRLARATPPLRHCPRHVPDSSPDIETTTPRCHLPERSAETTLHTAASSKARCRRHC